MFYVRKKNKKITIFKNTVTCSYWYRIQYKEEYPELNTVILSLNRCKNDSDYSNMNFLNFVISANKVCEYYVSCMLHIAILVYSFIHRVHNKTRLWKFGTVLFRKRLLIKYQWQCTHNIYHKPRMNNKTHWSVASGTVRK